MIEVEASDREAVTEEREAAASQVQFQEAYRTQAIKQHKAGIARMAAAKAGFLFQETVKV